MMKTIVIIGAVAFILLAVAFFGGFIPIGALIEDGLDTISADQGGAFGNKDRELLDSKAYILSYKDDGFSEKIVVSGTIYRTSWSFADIHLYRYMVKLKKNAWSNYEYVSVPGQTSMYLNNPNPGSISCRGEFAGEGSGETFTCVPYVFNLVGNDYADGSIKVELWGYMKHNQLNPLEEMNWKYLASDEAYLYSGYGGLYLPRGIEDDVDRPYDTFEVGQEVDIRVETAKGGYDSESKPWRVTLNEPYGGDIDNPDDGGGVVLEKSYGNDVTNGHFKFTVTEEMAQKSMQSSEPYTIRIWNVLLPKGSLYVDFIDFISKAPGDVEFSVSGVQGKVGEKYSVGLSADSDIGIDYFRVSVIYGTNDVLLPSDPLSNLWLVHTTNLGSDDGRTCNQPQKIEFVPEYSSYVTVHAKAFDLEGRGSVRTRTWTMFAYEDSEVPDETIEGETGEEDYGGGETTGQLPWDPSGGNWEDTGEGIEIDGLGVLIGILIVLGFALLGFFVFKDPWIIAVLVIIGIIVAVLVYAVFFTDIFAGIIVFS